MKKLCLSALLLFLVAVAAAGQPTGRAAGLAAGRDAAEVKTTFQTASSWKPEIDVRADGVMVYGPGALGERINSWRERGYAVHFMTGIAWGDYGAYLNGDWDGRSHLDEAQRDAAGNPVLHGPGSPYYVPTLSYLEYLKQVIIKPVIDEGVDAIFLEEPEFWAFSGYSEAFKREWQDHYGMPWQPQHSSPENTYLSNKLKYRLYIRALDEVFRFAKEYGRSKGIDVKCYVPTHSLLSYSQIRMVSPEAGLASLPSVDGYIAQVWTGTARCPNRYRGVAAERVFEAAFLEYGSMASMTAPTGRKLFFLTDPVEDARRDWADYKRNYEATFVAQLLYPAVADFEIMPWPNRIYCGTYPKGPDSDERIPIPPAYATQMQVMTGALNDMPRGSTRGRISGTQGVSVLMGNSLMFQRFPEHAGYHDPELSNYFGLAMPFVKRGVPVGAVHLENLAYPEALEGTRVLLMTYSNLKPLDPEAHRHLAEWVKRGGSIVYCGRDDDPFQGVREWWNSGSEGVWAAPSDHLFSLMGIPPGAAAGDYTFGEGRVTVLRQDPKEFVAAADAESPLIDAVERLYEMGYSNHFTLERGKYLIAAVMKESVSDEPLRLRGRFIDLFNPDLPVCQDVTLPPGESALLIDLSKVGRQAQVLAAAGRCSEESRGRRTYSFVCRAPLGTEGVARVRLPRRPRTVTVDGVDLPASWDDSVPSASLDAVGSSASWDSTSRTLLLRFSNSPSGVHISLRW